MSLKKFVDSDFTNQNISDLSDTPNLNGMSASQLKAYFDNIPKNIVAKIGINHIIDQLEATTDGQSGADCIGATVVGTLEGSTVQAILESEKNLIDSNQTAQGLVNTSVQTALSDRYTKAETGTQISTATSGLIKNVTYNSTTGELTFTKNNDTTIVIDTPMEKIPATLTIQTIEGVEYLVITNLDGTTTKASIDSFIKNTEFVDSSTIDFTATASSVTAIVKDHSIGETQMETGYLTSCQSAKTDAETAKTASESARDLAQGYKNDALDYKTAAQGSASAASSSATEALGYKNSASVSAGSASTSATTSSTYATTSESWAVGGTGTRIGENTNNAKYWCEQAQHAVTGGVTSFNGRAGIVVPVSGDYDKTMVGLGNVDNTSDATKKSDFTGSIASANTGFVTGGDVYSSLQTKADTSALSSKADKSTSTSATLLSASWTGTEAPYTYTLSVSGVTSTSNQEILPTTDITTAQLEALQGANIQDGGQSTDTITLKAYGDKPTVDIPIRVLLRGD